VLDEEWGNTGRELKLFLQIFSGQLVDIQLKNTKYLAPPGVTQLPTEKFNIHIELKKDVPFSEDYILKDLNDIEKKGVNFIKMLMDIQNNLLEDLNKNTIGLIGSEEKPTAQRVFRTKAIFDFKKYPFNHLQFGDGFMTFDGIEATYLLSISESKLVFDRAINFNYVLIIENYITKQKNFVAKNKETSFISLSKPIVKDESAMDLRNGATIKVNTDYYVGVDLPEGLQIEDINNVEVKFQTSV